MYRKEINIELLDNYNDLRFDMNKLRYCGVSQFKTLVNNINEKYSEFSYLGVFLDKLNRSIECGTSYKFINDFNKSVSNLCHYKNYLNVKNRLYNRYIDKEVLDDLESRLIDDIEDYYLYLIFNHFNLYITDYREFILHSENLIELIDIIKNNDEYLFSYKFDYILRIINKSVRGKLKLHKVRNYNGIYFNEYKISKIRRILLRKFN